MKLRKVSRLKDVKLDFVSFVDAGAHQSADVVLMKRDPEAPDDTLVAWEIGKADPTPSDAHVDTPAKPAPRGKAKKKSPYDFGDKDPSEDLTPADEEDAAEGPEGADEESDAEDAAEGEEEPGDAKAPPSKKKVTKARGVVPTRPSVRSTVTPMSQEATPMPDDTDLSAYSEEQLHGYVLKLEDMVIEKDQRIEQLVEALDADIEKSDETVDFDEILKAADPALAEYLRKSETARAEAEARAVEAEEIAKVEREERRDREAVAKAEALSHISTTTEDLAALLKRLDETDPELADEVHKLLVQADAQIESGDLFAEIGKAAPQSVVGSELDSIAKNLQAADPSLTEAQAIDRALTEHPDLYAAHLNDNGGR